MYSDGLVAGLCKRFRWVKKEEEFCRVVTGHGDAAVNGDVVGGADRACYLRRISP